MRSAQMKQVKWKRGMVAAGAAVGSVVIHPGRRVCCDGDSRDGGALFLMGPSFPENAG